MTTTETLPSSDVVICGGGLAGLTLAMQLRRELPQLSVMVLERTRRPLREAAHKVGESSVELGSQYLERLGLREYLEREHIIKFGLRFFPGGGELPLRERAELGPAHEPIVRSYQLDRGKLETDLRAMIEDAGVKLVEGAVVRPPEIGSGDTPHTIIYDVDDARHQVQARWVVDATGRTGLIKRQMKLGRGSRHPAHAGWFRVEGRVELGELVPDPSDPWHGASGASDRWRSTNHLMGKGYWVWLIPLAGERTSVGVVVHGDVHDFERMRKYEHVMAFLREYEPHIEELLTGREVLDFRCLKGYSHGVARSWHTDRWAIVGEAGAFVDPLYSPGTDFIAYANSFTTELIRIDIAGGDLSRRIGELNAQYRALVSGSLELYRDLAEVYGHARAMGAKLYWDNFVYWSYACQYYLQGLYKETGSIYAEVNEVGARYVELSGYVQALCASWAKHLPQTRPQAGFVGMPAFPSLPVSAHLDLQKSMNPTETLAYMRERLLQAEAMAAEIVVRLLVEAGPEIGEAILAHAGVSKWALAFDPSRVDAEAEVGLARRRALSIVARDVERSLGRVTQHPRWREALALVLPNAVMERAVGS